MEKENEIQTANEVKVCSSISLNNRHECTQQLVKQGRVN